jgi:uncharacterized metal-binding protein
MAPAKRLCQIVNAAVLRSAVERSTDSDHGCSGIAAVSSVAEAMHRVLGAARGDAEDRATRVVKRSDAAIKRAALVRRPVEAAGCVYIDQA